MKRRVVITGLGCVSPLGPDVASLWRCLVSRFDTSTFEVKLAAEVKEPVVGFSEHASFFTEDVKVLFALEACRQALVDSGLCRLGSSALLHLGTSLETLDLGKVVYEGRTDFASVADRLCRPGARPLQVPLDTAAELIQERWGTANVALTNVSACAASTQAIGHAFRRVRDGSCELAVCGGFDSMINPLGVGGFQLLGALATGLAQGPLSCRPFDSSRSGTVLGEGAAILVLETLESARKRRARVYGEILGHASSLDAYKVSAPDPSGAGARLAMLAALDDAGLPAAKVDAVSAHGTGTYLNDEVEAAALRQVLGPRWQTTPVIATKALVGHLIGAAGAIEVAAALQAFAQSALHPNPSLSRVASGCELDHVTGAPRPFDGDVILKNSFGFGGQNASLVLKRTR